jgi:hypothetical protein
MLFVGLESDGRAGSAAWARIISNQSGASTIDINDWSTGDSATILLVSNALRPDRGPADAAGGAQSEFD